MNRLEVKDLSIDLGGKPILSNINFSVPTGQCVCVMGSSGTGKTTLLKTVAGIIKPELGVINTYDGKLSYLFQEHRLLPWCDAYTNISLVSKGDTAPDDIYKLMKQLGLDVQDRHKYPDELSGGMCQRISLARALINKPNLLLMDEPFSSLDFPLRIRMHGIILELLKQKNVSLLLVTHDREEAIRLADHIIRIEGKPASAVEELSLPPHGNTPRSANFIRNYIEHNIFKGIEDNS